MITQGASLGSGDLHDEQLREALELSLQDGGGKLAANVTAQDGDDGCLSAASGSIPVSAETPFPDLLDFLESHHLNVILANGKTVHVSGASQPFLLIILSLTSTRDAIFY